MERMNMGITTESINILERKNQESQRLRESILQTALRVYGVAFDDLRVQEQFYVVGLALRDRMVPQLCVLIAPTVMQRPSARIIYRWNFYRGACSVIT